MNQIPEHITKKAFAHQAGISRPTLYKWLRGDQVTPVIENAILATLRRLQEEQEPEPAA